MADTPLRTCSVYTDFMGRACGNPMTSTFSDGGRHAWLVVNTDTEARGFFDKKDTSDMNELRRS